MANQAVGRPLGGIIGELAKLGINVVPNAAQPSLGTVEFTGPIEVTGGEVTLESNAGTLSNMAGKITTEALTTAAGAAATLTITNTLVDADDIILVTRNGGTSDEGTPEFTATPGAGSFVILLENRHASAAFDGTFIFGFLVIKQAA